MILRAGVRSQNPEFRMIRRQPAFTNLVLFSSDSCFSNRFMLRLRQATYLSAILAAVLLLLFMSQPATVLASDEGVRADLPLGGSLRVENRRGSVSVEVWNERYVSITATVEGRTPNRSPVIIERTEPLLTVGVVNQTAVTPARVDLILRIPERSRVQIITATGAINVRG